MEEDEFCLPGSKLTTLRVEVGDYKIKPPQSFVQMQPAQIPP